MELEPELSPKLKIPFSAEAEVAVIGGLLLNKDAWEDICELLVPEDFYVRDHSIIYEVMHHTLERGDPLDILTLGEILKQRLSSQQSPGNEDAILVRLAHCANETPSAENAAFYARIVRDHAMRRRLIAASSEIMTQARQGDEETSSLLDLAEQKIFEIGDINAKVSDFASLAELGIETIKQAEELRQKGAITGLGTGYKEFDRQTGGLQKGDLLILAGRPSMGKTALALNVAERVALKADEGPVVIFSMEMSTSQISQRICSSIGRINQLRLRTGSLHPEEWPRLTHAVDILKGGKNQIFIDDTPALRPDTLRAKARRFKRKHKALSLIVVDYLQLMRPLRAAENRNVEITQISYALKALARELNVPVVVLSQLNRNLEQRTNKRPIMSDLRESGSLEQDADLIIFIYRDEVYNENSEDKGLAEIHIAKQRNGPQFMTKLTFLGEYTRFEDRVSHIDDEEVYQNVQDAHANDADSPFE